MIQLTLTKTQHDSIKAFLDLLEIRKNEDSIKKQTNINAHSIATYLQIDYKCVKVALTNLNKKINERL